MGHTRGGDTLFLCVLHTIAGACVFVFVTYQSGCLRVCVFVYVTYRCVFAFVTYQWRNTLYVCVCVLQRKPLIQQTKCPQCHGDVHGPWQKGEMWRCGDEEMRRLYEEMRRT